MQKNRLRLADFKHGDHIGISRADSVRRAGRTEASLFLPGAATAQRDDGGGATISKSLNYRHGRLLSEERHLICTRKSAVTKERTVRSLKYSKWRCVSHK